MTDIFLSYTERDRDTARRLAEVLDAAGWSVWWDRRIPAGETWRSVLQQALEDMRCMVVLWSTKSIESEWVCEEAAEGRRLGKLVPVLIEAVRPPAGFREIQAADLTGWSGSSEFHGLRMLLSDLERLLGKPEEGSTGGETLNGNVLTHGGAPTGIDSSKLSQTPDLASQNTSARHDSVARWSSGPYVIGVALIGSIAIFGMRTEPHKGPAPKTETAEPISPPQAVDVPSSAPSGSIVPSFPTSSVPQPSTQETRVKTEQSIDPHYAKENRAAPATSTVIKRSESVPRSATDCPDLLMRIQLGETLSETSQMKFNKECRP